VNLSLWLILATAAPAATAPVAEVVEAELRFARTAREKGVSTAFRTFAAPDAIVFAPDPKPAKPLLEAAPEAPGTLEWWPIYAGVAASGDLGFTTGPFVQERGPHKRYGNFFTVWRRQGDGSWRWVLDHGPTSREPAPYGPQTAVATLAAGEGGGGPAKAWDSLIAAETALANGLAADARAALKAALADDARVLRPGPQPGVGRAAYEPLVEEGPARIEARHIGGGVSSAGDLAFTYGRAGWGAERNGHYIRMWQRRQRGWTLVVDQLVPPPPPPPPKP
jgi:ketosteroid isomerase-like protein